MGLLDLPESLAKQDTMGELEWLEPQEHKERLD
jgi:hypothetical protein